MVNISLTKVIDAPAERIYSLITDFEQLPSRFPSRYKTVAVKERSNNSVIVEEDITVAGREIHQVTKHVVEPGQKLRSEVLEGDTKGTVVEITLQPVGAKTSVSIDADLKLGKLGAVLGIFAKGKIKSGLERMIDEFESKAR